MSPTAWPPAQLQPQGFRASSLSVQEVLPAPEPASTAPNPANPRVTPHARAGMDGPAFLDPRPPAPRDSACCRLGGCPTGRLWQCSEAPVLPL